MDQSNRLKIYQNFIINLDQERLRIRIKNNTYKSAYPPYEDRELTYNASKVEYFQ